MDFVKTRLDWKANDDRRDKDNVIPANQKIIKNIKYGNESLEVLDINYPLKKLEKYPLIISIHGGGYFYGDKETYRFYCAYLAREFNFVVVNFSYLLAPEFKFPHQLIDINKIFDFVKDNNEKYQFDLNNIFVVGDSAGAQLASHYAILKNSKALQDLLNIYPNDLKIKALGLNCGLYDLKKFIYEREYYFEKEDIETLKSEPLKFINKDFPPSFILSASDDFLKDEQAPFKALLDSLNVENELRIYQKDTPLYHVFHCDLNNKYGLEANKEECAFFQKFINLE